MPQIDYVFVNVSAPGFNVNLPHGTSMSAPLVTLSCGEFPVGQRPVVGTRYQVIVQRAGGQQMPPINMYCIWSGGTSQFSINRQNNPTASKKKLSK